MKGFEQYYKKEEEMKPLRRKYDTSKKHPKTPKEQPEKNEKQKEEKRLRMENRRLNYAKRMANYKKVLHQEYLKWKYNIDRIETPRLRPKIDTIYSSDVRHAHTLIDDSDEEDEDEDKDLLEQRYFQELQHFEKLETERFDKEKKKYKGDAEGFKFEHDEALLEIKKMINDAYDAAKEANKNYDRSAYDAAKEANKKARRAYLANPDDNSKKTAMDTAKKSLKAQLLLLEKVTELDLISIIEEVKKKYPVNHIFYQDNTILKKEQAAVKEMLKEKSKESDEKRAKADAKSNLSIMSHRMATYDKEDKLTELRRERRHREERNKQYIDWRKDKHKPSRIGIEIIRNKKDQKVTGVGGITPRVQLRF
jgi:hypothetical protein